MEHNMEAYFNDQRLRQAHNAQIKQSIMPSISMTESKQALGAKSKKQNKTIAWSIIKLTEENVDKILHSKLKKETQSNL